MGKTAALSQLYSNKINTDPQGTPPVSHIALGVAFVAGFIVACGVINYKADH